MHSPGGMPGGSRRELGPFDQEHILPACLRQVIEHAYADDAAADHDYLGVLLHVCFRFKCKVRGSRATDRSGIGDSQAYRGLGKPRPVAETLDQPRAKQSDRGVTQAFRMSNEVVPITVIEDDIEGSHKPAIA